MVRRPTVPAEPAVSSGRTEHPFSDDPSKNPLLNPTDTDMTVIQDEAEESQNAPVPSTEIGVSDTRKSFTFRASERPASIPARVANRLQTLAREVASKKEKLADAEDILSSEINKVLDVTGCDIKDIKPIIEAHGITID